MAELVQLIRKSTQAREPIYYDAENFYFSHGAVQPRKAPTNITNSLKAGELYSLESVIMYLKDMVAGQDYPTYTRNRLTDKIGRVAPSDKKTIYAAIEESGKALTPDMLILLPVEQRVASAPLSSSFASSAPLSSSLSISLPASSSSSSSSSSIYSSAFVAPSVIQILTPETAAALLKESPVLQHLEAIRSQYTLRDKKGDPLKRKFEEVVDSDPELKQTIEKSALVCGRIARKERTFGDKYSFMDVPSSRSTSTGFFASLLQEMRKLKEEDEKRVKGASAGGGNGGAHPVPHYVSRYDRMETRGLRSQEELIVDERATMDSILADPSALSLPTPYSAVPNAGPSMMPNSFFATVPSSSYSIPKPLAPPSSSSSSSASNLPYPAASSSSSAAAASSSSSRAAPGAYQIPYIVVPAGVSSAVNMYNAAQFLRDATWVSPQAAMKAGVKKEQRLKIERVLPSGRRMQFYIIEDPTKLNAQDWDRVVAAFALGQKWQFKGWFGHPEPDLADIFSRMRGFHIKFDTEAVNDAVTKWAVKVLQISRNDNKRHLDNGAVHEFWRDVEDFMVAKKSHLLPK